MFCSISDCMHGTNAQKPSINSSVLMAKNFNEKPTINSSVFMAKNFNEDNEQDLLEEVIITFFLSLFKSLLPDYLSLAYMLDTYPLGPCPAHMLDARHIDVL